MRTPNLQQLLDQVIQIAKDGVLVGLPAYVVKYDPEKQCADVQPYLMKPPFGFVRNESESVKLPIITSVPVEFPRADMGNGAYACMYWPVKKGTKVELRFIDYSIDGWVQKGDEITDPLNVRRHDLNDCIAVPALHSFDSPIPDLDPSDIRLVLHWPDRKIHSEFYLGGDTGDIVAIPQNLIRLGDKDADHPLVMFDKLITALDYAVTQVMAQDGGAKALTALKTALQNGTPGDPSLAPASTTKVKAE